jgi:hypothetical protein
LEVVDENLDVVAVGLKVKESKMIEIAAVLTHRVRKIDGSLRRIESDDDLAGATNVNKTSIWPVDNLFNQNHVRCQIDAPSGLWYHPCSSQIPALQAGCGGTNPAWVKTWAGRGERGKSREATFKAQPVS